MDCHPTVTGTSVIVSLPKMSMTLTAIGVAARRFVGVLGGGQFQVAVLAGAEALPFVLEDVAAGPAFLEIAIDTRLAALRSRAATRSHQAGSARHFDDLLAAFVVEIHRPVVHPVGPVLRQHVAW